MDVAKCMFSVESLDLWEVRSGPFWSIWAACRLLKPGRSEIWVSRLEFQFQSFLFVFWDVLYWTGTAIQIPACSLLDVRSRPKYE